ncbi:MAG: hypothetical protein GVY31_06165 [Alphaproteobacteria bacterium]|nr:hypothetical protein [Alphaproteobacteria bacterium]
MTLSRSLAALVLGLAATPALADGPQMLTYGPRPAFLISQMEDGALNDRLSACMGQSPAQSKFSIGHRGAPLMFPEHTAESNIAAAQMGAGILECDVTFTADHELVCRHAQNDLHTTTDIVPSALAEKAKAADLGLITWTLERSGPLGAGGGWYYQSVSDAISRDGDYFKVLDALAQDVGVIGVFSDWPATTTYYANCMGL